MFRSLIGVLVLYIYIYICLAVSLEMSGCELMNESLKLCAFIMWLFISDFYMTHCSSFYVLNKNCLWSSFFVKLLTMQGVWKGNRFFKNKKIIRFLLSSRSSLFLFKIYFQALFGKSEVFSLFIDRWAFKSFIWGCFPFLPVFSLY